MSSISSGNFAKIVLNPGETYRVATGGTATVEAIYGAPNGTTTVTANSVTFGPYGVNAKLKVTATSGACDVFKVEKVPLEAYPDGSLDPAGAEAVLGASGNLGVSIAAFGHSMMRNGFQQTYACGFSGTGSGIGGVLCQGAQASLGAGAKNLVWSASARTLTWDGGAPVVITRGGPWLIPGPTADTGIYCDIRYKGLPTIDTTTACTRSGTTPIWGFGAFNPLVQMQYASGRELTIHNYAAAGSELSDALAVMRSVLARRRYSAVVVHGLTNSIAIQGAAYRDAALAEAVEAITLIRQSGARAVWVQEIPVRTAFSTQAHRDAVTYINRALQMMYATDPGVAVLDPYRCMLAADPAATTLRTGWSLSADNTHPGDAAAFFAGRVLWEAVAPVIGKLPYQFGSALTPYSATNPYGTLTPNTHHFGDSAGLSTGYAKSDTSVTGSASKVARNDGIDGHWQRNTLSSGAANGCVSHIQFGAGISGGAVAIQVPAAGTWVRGRFEVSVSSGANLLVPDVRLIAYQSTTVLAQARSMTPQNNALGMHLAAHSGVLTTAPMRTPTGADGLTVWMSAYGANSAAGVVDWGQYELRPLSADEVFDEYAYATSIA